MEVNGYEIAERTFMTGEVPVQSYGVCGGRDDFDIGLLRVTWAGCLDAVEWICTGTMKVVPHEGYIVPGIVKREI